MTTVADSARARCSGLLADPSVAAVAPAVERALHRLDLPLVVAVTGHVSAGKSTLINALAGRRITATGAAETTLVSWWLRRGSDERIVARRRSGLPLEVPIGGDLRMSEDELDIDAREPITAWVDSPLLEDLVLVDTPGLFSPNDERSARTRELTRAQTARAAAGADAVVYVTADAPGSKRDVAELDAFGAAFPDLGHAPTNALIVLNKADRFWPGSDDPRATARAALDAVRPAWRTRAWQAIPVAALLTEAHLGPDDHAALAELGARDDAASAIRVLAARARSAAAEGPQVALVRRLGPYGVFCAARALAAGDDPGAVLHAASGVGEVREAIERMFRRRSLTMRTDRLLRELEAIAFGADVDPVVSARLRSVVEEIRSGQDGSGLRVLMALRLADDPRVRIDDAARDELRVLFQRAPAVQRLGAPDGTEPPLLAACARERARWWRVLEGTAPAAPERRWLAAQAAAAYTQIARELERFNGAVRW